MSSNTYTLKEGVIGEFRLVWQAMGALSIAADASYLLTGVALFALGATPLSILLGVVFYLFIMNSGYQFSKYISSAGSYYTFAAKSLGPKIGIFQAWNMIFYSILGYSSFGFLGLAAFISMINPSLNSTAVWVTIAVAAATIAFLFTYFGIKTSTDYQILGGVIEVSVLIIGSILIIISAGNSNTLLVFTTKYIPGGLSQIFYSMIYSVVLFFGTTLSITSLAEEAKNPHIAVRRALISTIVVAGITLILVSYAFTIGYGPTNMGAFIKSPDPGLVMFKHVSYILYILLIAVTVNSFMGYNVSVSNANTRIYYSFARSGILFLPRSLKKIHERYGSPYNSAIFVFIVSLSVGLAFGFAFGPEIGGLVMLFANGYAAYTEHIVASIGLPFYAKKMGDFKVLQHLVFPIIAVGVLAAVIFFTLYPAPPAYPYNIAAYVGIGWIPFAGLMTLIELKKRGISNTLETEPEVAKTAENA